jgi:hypothetical protein
MVAALTQLAGLSGCAILRRDARISSWYQVGHAVGLVPSSSSGDARW